ncbi:hypothetical protein SM124_08055 [Bacillus sp. 31A1R]|uniref:Plasmid segregation centromere-binding protein ParR n=1 Tax=Robertmurraya mangrovi TaxID=3098077 RepID=A0ABU5IX47_9BACI|nr:hypothetical protein [Bacillus sp. 31A1R]MDZ5471697.1 hypothetical protein [Bacillus sp. 31A1R]
MKKSNMGEIKRGQTISFRIPSDTPDHLLKHLQKLKETERRNFSSKIADFVMQGVGSSNIRNRETVTVPLPQSLSKTQRNWLKNEHSEALIGSIIYQLLSDPVRATSLLASLNSNSLDINEALYLQEEPEEEKLGLETYRENSLANNIEQTASTDEFDFIEEEDDLSEFDWDTAKQSQSVDIGEEKELESNLEDLLGDFLETMNK